MKNFKGTDSGNTFNDKCDYFLCHQKSWNGIKNKTGVNKVKWKPIQETKFLPHYDSLPDFDPKKCSKILLNPRYYQFWSVFFIKNNICPTPPQDEIGIKWRVIFLRIFFEICLPSDAHAKVKKWIFGVILNDFWSSTI